MPELPAAHWRLTMASDDITIKHISQTLGRIELSDFLPDDSRLRDVSVLRPILACVKESRVIDKDKFIIGRDNKADFTLKDQAVSSRHARILRQGSECVLEDLGSSNGTYVDGIPIVSCILKGGDMVTVGRNLFLFDHLLEYTETEVRPD